VQNRITLDVGENTKVNTLGFHNGFTIVLTDKVDPNQWVDIEVTDKRAALELYRALQSSIKSYWPHAFNDEATRAAGDYLTATDTFQCGHSADAKGGAK